MHGDYLEGLPVADTPSLFTSLCYQYACIRKVFRIYHILECAELLQS